MRYSIADLPADVYVRFAEAGKPPMVGETPIMPGYPGPPGRLVVHDVFVAGMGRDDGRGPSYALPSDVLRRVPLGQIEAWANGIGAEAIRHLLNKRAGPGIRGPVSKFVKVAAKDALKRPTEAASLQLSEKHRAIAESRQRPYPDDFYQAVADIYRSAASMSRAPAPLIADANGVEVGTVHRWVRMARKRGLLPLAAKGKKN